MVGRKDTTGAGDNYGAGVRSPGDLSDGGAALFGHWQVTIRDPDGNILREDTFDNLVVNEGLDHLLDVTLSAATQTTSWFLGLTDSAPTTDATDTMGSHSGWTEVTAYDEAARPGWSDGGVSGQSVDNSGSPATFTINADSTTIGGAFLSSDDTVGGTAGLLYAVGAFSGGDITLNSGSTVDVTATFTTQAA